MAKKVRATKDKKGDAKFSAEQMNLSSAAFAEWLLGTDTFEGEAVTPYTVLGLSAVLRSVSVISTTIAGLPLKTYEREGDQRQRIPSVFDDPYPDIDAGMTPFAWVETILIHECLWRHAFLWHEERDTRSGDVIAYRPIVPDAFEVKRENGKRVFKYTDGDTKEVKTVGSEMVTYIPGPSIDGIRGHPLLTAARAIFSGALSGDKAASTTLRRGIRLAGLVTPAEGEEIDPKESETILEHLRQRTVGRENAGDIAYINRHLKLDPWTPSNVDSQWLQARQMAVDEVGRIFGMPPHLLNAIEKQTSWGTGVAEQNLGLARYTLMGWSTRIEQVLSRRLPAGQFVEFDYAGLLQGTPEDEIRLLLDQVDSGLMTLDEARAKRNMPPLTREQKAEMRPPTPRPGPRPIPIRREETA